MNEVRWRSIDGRQWSLEQYLREKLREEYDRGFCDGYDEGGRDAIIHMGFNASGMNE
jgi:hypothetical protein